MAVQHASYCNRNGRCRFEFPKPPSEHSVIAEPLNDKDLNNTLADKQKDVLAKVCKIVSESQSCNLSLEQAILKAGVDKTAYQSALQTSTKGPVVVLKRSPKDCFVNNYNPTCLRAWNANLDIQFVLNAYACVMYVASYIMKTEKAMGKLLKQVADEYRTEELKTKLNRVGSAFLTHREVSAQEAVYRTLSIPMKHLSRAVVFTNTSPKSKRIAVLKDKKSLNDMQDDDTNVFQTSLVDRYVKRPDSLESICFAEFAAKYTTDYNKDDDGDVIPKDTNTTKCARITLKDKFGTMRARQKEAVIRFTKYHKDSDTSNWYRSKLMLYFPWRNEDTDLLGRFSSYEQHYNVVKRIVLDNESKYTLSQVEEIDVDIQNVPEHAWNLLAPCTEAFRTQMATQRQESLTEMSAQDLRDNSQLLASSSSNRMVTVRFVPLLKPPLSNLNYTDRCLETSMKNNAKLSCSIVNGIKDSLRALKQSKPIEPYRVFVSGPGGVGKSHIIKLIHSDTIKFFKLASNLMML